MQLKHMSVATPLATEKILTRFATKKSQLQHHLQLKKKTRTQADLQIKKKSKLQPDLQKKETQQIISKNYKEKEWLPNLHVRFSKGNEKVKMRRKNKIGTRKQKQYKLNRRVP